MEVCFTKYSGCGNDFILIDNCSAALNLPLPKSKVTQLCHRHNGIGADGIIFLETSTKADFKMRIFNSDGSEAEMCGNGIRCLARFIEDLGLAKKTFSIETMESIIEVDVEGTCVSVHMPSPKKFIDPFKLNIEDTAYEAHHLDTGVPHCVIFVDEIEDDTHLTHAPTIRHHPAFHPQGANVNFAKIVNSTRPKATILLRTYERGVEAETQACGTGAVATALIAAHAHGLTSPITIQTRSQDQLEISFTSYDDIKMKGPANKIFSGSFVY